MNDFYVDAASGCALEAYEVVEGECNSTACAVGSCAVSGIKSLKLEKDESWADYSDRVFGELDNMAGLYQVPGMSEGTLWDYCFSAYWNGTGKDTAADAAIRMMEVANYLENSDLVG